MDPANPAHVYAVYNGYSRRWIPGGGSGHVFESTDGGAHLDGHLRQPARRAQRRAGLRRWQTAAGHRHRRVRRECGQRRAHRVVAPRLEPAQHLVEQSSPRSRRVDRAGGHPRPRALADPNSVEPEYQSRRAAGAALRDKGVDQISPAARRAQSRRRVVSGRPRGARGSRRAIGCRQCGQCGAPLTVRHATGVAGSDAVVVAHGIVRAVALSFADQVVVALAEGAAVGQNRVAAIRLAGFRGVRAERARVGRFGWRRATVRRWCDQSALASASSGW